ncbi:MAG: tetratricopeptide repeat protein [Bdellovibrionales bacterium]|nr:tetratricopeptide repeat protein [Bdellovibrionales bacterium]
MKKVSLLGLLVLTIIFSFFVLSKQNEAVIVSNPQKINLSSTRKLFLGARKKATAIEASTQTATVSDGCEEVTSQLELVDFNIPADEWLETLQLSVMEKCALPEFKQRIASIKAACFDSLDEAICTQQALFLRSLLRTRGITETEDQDLLADMVISEFADSTPDFHKLETISEKLMNINPDQASYQKLWASSKIISTMYDNKSPAALAEELAEKIDDHVWNDTEMQGLKMAVATGLTPDNVEGYARGFLSQKKDPRMHEVLGWALWRQNRTAEAVQELKRAIALSPDDPWLKDQLGKVLSTDADKESYQARISLGINLQDLYN